MGRMGHDSMRAALIYQHASIDADRHIAEALGTQLALFWSDTPEQDDGGDEGSGPTERTG